MTIARYDGLAEWYDREFAGDGPARQTVLALLGDGPGRLLDVGCGSGAHTTTFAERGWDVVGVDISEDLLDRARARGVEVINADAASLPFPDASFDAVVSMWTHTDVEDFGAVVRDGARVLRRGGAFVYLGVHPCFVGPHSVYDVDRKAPELHPDWYRKTGRYDEAPGIWRGSGVRIRVGASHLPLGLFLQTFLDAGLRLERIEEPAEREYSFALASRWRR